MFYWLFHFENEISINCLLTRWKWTYILVGALKMKCMQYGILWISDFQECKDNGFFEVGRMGNNFWLGPKNLDFLDGRLPLPAYSSHEKFLGGGGFKVLFAQAQIANPNGLLWNQWRDSYGPKVWVNNSM